MYGSDNEIIQVTKCDVTCCSRFSTVFFSWLFTPQDKWYNKSEKEKKNQTVSELSLIKKKVKLLLNMTGVKMDYK